MAKDLQWFKFSPLNWMTGRIRKEKDKIQIAFIELICQYWKNECNMTIEQAELEIGDSVHQLLKKKIVKSEGVKIKIGFLDEQMNSIEHTSAQRSNAAKSRWNADAMQVHASALQVHNDALQNDNSAMQTDADKIREDKTRESITHGKGKLTITIKKVFASDKTQIIHNLEDYYESTGQLLSLKESGWIHFAAFMKANSGKVFNEPDHLYNTFRNFCTDYKPPPKEKSKFEDAEYNKTLWTKEAWEDFYGWRLKKEPEFRKHFGYGELSVSKSMGGGP